MPLCQMLGLLPNFEGTQYLIHTTDREIINGFMDTRSDMRKVALFLNVVIEMNVTIEERFSES